MVFEKFERYSGFCPHRKFSIVCSRTNARLLVQHSSFRFILNSMRFSFLYGSDSFYISEVFYKYIKHGLNLFLSISI